MFLLVTTIVFQNFYRRFWKFTFEFLFQFRKSVIKYWVVHGTAYILPIREVSFQQILTLVMVVFCWTDIFVRWFEDYQLPTITYGSNSFSSSLLHMFQLSRFEWEAPVLRGLLQTCSSLKSLVLRWSWLKYWIFMNFSSRSHFLQTQCENLGS